MMANHKMKEAGMYDDDPDTLAEAEARESMIQEA